MSFSIIAAYAKNRVIGNNNEIPWRKTKEDLKRYREDMQRFASLTTAHVVIMGRKTYDSIPRKFKPLSGRVNIVVTRNPTYHEQGVVICHSMEDAMREAEARETLTYIAGGQQIYELAIKDPRVTRMNLTKIHTEYKGDAFFPEFNLKEWKETKRDEREHYSFVTYERV